MLKVTKTFVALALILACVASVDAAEKKKKKGKKGTRVRIQALQFPDSIELSAEQKEKVAALRKEFSPKFAAMQKKNREILTEDQIKARQKAMKEARDAGKKGKEIQSAVTSALDLSDDQKKQMKELSKETRSLNDEVRGKVSKILTEEQRAKIKPAKGAKKKKKKKNS